MTPNLPSTRRNRPIVSTSWFLSLPRAALACLLLVAASAQAQTPPPVTETIPGTTVKLTLNPIPAGKVTLTDPTDPAKKQEIEVKPFLMSTTEVTFDAFDIFVYALDETEQTPGTDATTRPSKPYIPPDRGFGHSGYAAIGMSFKSADEFCTWLTKKTGHKYRLPTEAEWEYAAGAKQPGAYGVDPAHLADYAWFKDNADAKTHPVGTKKPNAWQLSDMLGNAAEWVVGADGKPVTKGGSFKDEVTELEVSDRLKQSPSWNASDPQMPKSKWWLADCSFVGFRIVRELDIAAPALAPTAPNAQPKPATPPSPKDRIDDHPAPSIPK